MHEEAPTFCLRSDPEARTRPEVKACRHPSALAKTNPHTQESAYGQDPGVPEIGHCSWMSELQ